MEGVQGEEGERSAEWEEGLPAAKRQRNVIRINRGGYRSTGELTLRFKNDSGTKHQIGIEEKTYYSHSNSSSERGRKSRTRNISEILVGGHTGVEDVEGNSDHGKQKEGGEDDEDVDAGYEKKGGDSEEEEEGEKSPTGFEEEEEEEEKSVRGTHGNLHGIHQEEAATTRQGESGGGVHRNDSDEVRAWLDRLGFAKYFPFFQHHAVRYNMLPLLSMEQFKEIGIEKLGHRWIMYQSFR